MVNGARTVVSIFFGRSFIIELIDHGIDFIGHRMDFLDHEFISKHLGDFFVKGVTVSSVMIERHHAVAYHGQSKEDIREAHLANRKKVRI